jgi:hypothetical protein
MYVTLIICKLVENCEGYIVQRTSCNLVDRYQHSREKLITIK